MHPLLNPFLLDKVFHIFVWAENNFFQFGILLDALFNPFLCDKGFHIFVCLDCTINRGKAVNCFAQIYAKIEESKAFSRSIQVIM